MSVLIDVIGATIAGAALIVTILFTIFNVQRSNFNINALLTLNTVANTVSETIDLEYFEHVGRNIEEADQIFVQATNTTFVYRMRTHVESNPASRLRTYRVQMLTNANNDIFLSVRRQEGTGAETEVFNSTPFFFNSTDVFVYLDEHGDPIANPMASLPDIHGIQVNLVYVTNSHAGADQRILFPVSFWRFFINSYFADRDGIVMNNAHPEDELSYTAIA